MTRAHYFGAGPAALPLACLQQLETALYDWDGCGVSILEVGHRSEKYMAMLYQAEQDFRELLAIPVHYKVIFTCSPARAHFSMIPLNFFGKARCAEYLITGMWSEMAAQEAERYGQVNIVCNSESRRFQMIPPLDSWQSSSEAVYRFYTANETVNGVQFQSIPRREDAIPLVCDMTSCLLSEPLDINQFGLIFAGAQKNIANSGMTIVIVREDLLNQALPETPSTFHYQLLAAQNSLLYTPNTLSCYMAALMFQWLKNQGGLAEIAKINRQKAEMLYAYIDESEYYENKIDPQYRSMMNIPFTLQDPQLQPLFLQEAEKVGLLGLSGHRAVGGLRASLYNAVTREAVIALIEFMKAFANR